MIKSYQGIYKTCEQNLEVGELDKKKSFCIDEFYKLKDDLPSHKLDFCIRKFCKAVYKDFIFLGIYQAIKTSDMKYMLNAIFQGNRLGTLIRNSVQGSFDQSENIVGISLALAANDLELLDKIMPYHLGGSNNGRYSSQYNMILALMNQDTSLGEKSKNELLKFVGKKHSVFDLTFSKYLLALYDHDLPSVEINLQEMCCALAKSNWIQEEIFIATKYAQLGRSVSLFAHGMYHLAYYCLKPDEFKAIHIPSHKSFIKEYEEYNLSNNFLMGKNLFDFNEDFMVLNHITDIDIIPEVSIFEDKNFFYHDSEGFLKEWLLNMRKNNLLDFDLEGDNYVFKTIA